LKRLISVPEEDDVIAFAAKEGGMLLKNGHAT
jgi:hypothetical protein